VSKLSSEFNLQESFGFVGGLVKQARLGWRLLQDSRVPAWVKVIPFAAFVYLLSPIDLIPDMLLPGLGELDDIVVLVLALKMFVDLSPSGVVREHLEELMGKQSGTRPDDEPASGPYIEVPYRVLDQNEE
jgi:uncharacterized membrane protein YkvA (DUF1232 family)